LSYETRHSYRIDRVACAYLSVAGLAAMYSRRSPLLKENKVSKWIDGRSMSYIEARTARIVANFKASTTALLSWTISVSRFHQMSAFRAFAMIFLCAGLIFQGSAAASAMPQTEPMLASDCAQMMHHSEESEAAHHHGGDPDSPCQEMSIDCLLAMNAVSPVWVESDSPSHIVKPLFDSPVYLSNTTPPLFSRASTPDYPPPRT
jgi:hypothetical protein